MTPTTNPITSITQTAPANSAQIGSLEHNGRIYDVYVTFEDASGQQMPLDRIQKTALERLQTQLITPKPNYSTTMSQLATELVGVHATTYPAIATENLGTITDRGLVTSTGQVYSHDNSKRTLENGTELYAKDLYETISKTLLDIYLNKQKKIEDFKPVISLVQNSANTPPEKKKKSIPKRMADYFTMKKPSKNAPPPNQGSNEKPARSFPRKVADYFTMKKPPENATPPLKQLNREESGKEKERPYTQFDPEAWKKIVQNGLPKEKPTWWNPWTWNYDGISEVASKMR